MPLQLPLPLALGLDAEGLAPDEVVIKGPDDWVAVTDTRNYILGDPALDWLDLYGAEHGFVKDSQRPGYDARLDFGRFIMEQGRRFETAVIELVRATNAVVQIAHGASLSVRAAETWAAMCEERPIIYQGVLLDEQARISGIPDLLVRSDVLARLFPSTLSSAEVTIPAAAIQHAHWHYRVIDIKFRTLGLLASGELNNDESAEAYKVQLHLYNKSLGRLQGYEPPTAYLLGRGWTHKGQRGSSCMERLAPVTHSGTLAKGWSTAEAAQEAIAWVRRLRDEGKTWAVLPTPTIPELYPNAKNTNAGNWGHAKKEIAATLEDVTMLWNVGEAARRKAHAVGVLRWTDARVTPDLLEISGEKKAGTLIRILEVNGPNAGQPVWPAQVQANRLEWHTGPPLEFYVDFETVSDLADDFALMPDKHGQPLIFMIGCGHVENGAWRFFSFTVDALSDPEEERIIDAWLGHMESVRRRLVPVTDRPRIIHWSHAEVSTLHTAYNSARERHAREDWADLPWYDFLVKVMREEPVVVKGALAFGLKTVAKAMRSHGFINTEWQDGPSDGLGAMVGAWSVQDEASRLRKPLSSVPLMQEIAAYNEVDCKVMQEIIAHLRSHH